MQAIVERACPNTFNYNLSLQCIVPKAVYIVKNMLLKMGESVTRNM